MVKAANLVGGLALVALLAGCGGGNREPDLESLDAATIYKLGEYQLENSRKGADAVRYFAEVERLYPYSEWAKRALIMQAFAYHKDRDYENSRA
ncbi:outer membrane protein assembly factor BamD, partial [Albidovulum sp.]